MSKPLVGGRHHARCPTYPGEPLRGAICVDCVYGVVLSNEELAALRERLHPAMDDVHEQAAAGRAR